MKKTVYFIVLTAIVHILSACSGSTVYDEYAHTPIAGWEKNDTLSFEVSPLLEPGHYKQSLGLRITGAYPFMGLTLIVEQTVYHRNRKIPGECKIDTVNCQLIATPDHEGILENRGSEGTQAFQKKQGSRRSTGKSGKAGDKAQRP